MYWLLVLSALSAAPTGPKPMPSMAKAPLLDGKLKDLSPSIELKVGNSPDQSATVRVKLAYFNDTLWLGAAVQDDVLMADDVLDLTLYFPESGPLARGYTYRFNMNGAVARVGENAPPDFAAKLVGAKVDLNQAKKVFTLEAAIPVRAWPRFQSKGPLLVSACVDYADVDGAMADAEHVTNCPTGDMAGGPTRIPDELRKVIKVTAPDEVEGLEARGPVWLGFGALASPSWLSSTEQMTAAKVAEWASNGQALPPESVALALPKSLTLLKQDTLAVVLVGKNPYVGEKCIPTNELRVWLYAMHDHEAKRVLDWPAANCQLGRAMQFDLSDDGNLIIGYTNGATARFTWAETHFERSELGMR